MYKLKTLKGQVEYCLKWNKKTRDDDMVLTIDVWREFYDVRGEVIAINNLLKLPRENNVGRIRRKFQERGKYMPNSLEIVKKRKLNEDKWREFMGYPLKEQNTSLF